MRTMFLSLCLLGLIRTADCAAAVGAPAEIVAFISPWDNSGLKQVLPLVYLSRQLPERIALQVYLGARYDTTKDSFEGLSSAEIPASTSRILHVLRKNPEKLFDYAECLNFDRTGLACDKIIGVDFSGFNPKDTKLREELKAHARTFESYAKTPGQENHLPAVFIDGKPYQRSFQLPELIAHLNSALPQDQRLPGFESVEAKRETAYPRMRLWAVENPDIKAERDKEWEAATLQLLPNLDIIGIAAASPEGKRLIKKAEIRKLPAYVFDETIEKQPEFGKALLDRKLATLNRGYYTLNRARYGGVLWEREPIPQEMTLFVMSQCSFGIKAEQAWISAVEAKKIPVGTKLRVRFIVRKSQDDSAFSSLHGTPEVEEDIRQLLIQKHFPDQFLKYLHLRNQNYLSCDWESPARKAGIDPAVVRDQWAEGEKLLKEDFHMAQEVGVTSSPTYLWENQRMLIGHADLVKAIGIDPYQILDPQKYDGSRGHCPN